ncbi:MAG: DM13 domain-containing protein [Gemmatimonadales bacterium]
MRMRLTSLALLLLAAPLAAQAGAGTGMDKGKMDHDKMMMKDHAMPAVPFEGVAPHTATGTFTMSVKDGKHFIEINKDFKSTGAPDGFVYLTKDGNVDASALELGELPGGQGGGTFPVPTDAKVWEYNTVVIWSKAHHAVVGKAPLHGSKMMHDSMMKKGDGMMKHDTGMMKKP